MFSLWCIFSDRRLKFELMTLYIRGWGKDLIFQQQKGVLMQQITHNCMLSQTCPLENASCYYLYK